LAKIILAIGVWLVYAVVLHAPINPSFRGRKVAVLSVVGFVLLLGVIVTVLLVPMGAS
jgi:ABC-type transport system involved in cytochrome c biogenesis permease subunit